MDELWEMCSLWNKMCFKVSRNGMLYCFKYYENDGAPWVSCIIVLCIFHLKIKHLLLFCPRTIFSDTPEDKVVQCKTKKSKHVQRKNFGTTGLNRLSRTFQYALWLWIMEKDAGYKLWASLSVEEDSGNFIWWNDVSQLQTNWRQLENSEQTEK